MERRRSWEGRIALRANLGRYETCAVRTSNQARRRTRIPAPLAVNEWASYARDRLRWRHSRGVAGFRFVGELTMRFIIGQVYECIDDGRQAVVVDIKSDGRVGLLRFLGPGIDEWFIWHELHQAGKLRLLGPTR
jgi:hypothetical protein